MSHPHEVPKGWERGEPLDWWEAGEHYRRFVVRQARMPRLRDGGPLPDDIAYITFDSREHLDAFVTWWHEGQTDQQIHTEAQHALVERDRILEALRK